MRTSDPKQGPTMPSAPTQSDFQSGVPFKVPSASRAVFVTEGVNQIQGPTRLQYVPYQRTIVQYEPVETIQYVPVQRKIIEYEERRRYQQVPIEETVQDFYAVQHVTEYVPHVIPQKKIEYVPVEKIQNRVEYYPVERELVYYPNHGKQYNSREQFYEAELNRMRTENVPTYATSYPPSYAPYQQVPKSVYGGPQRIDHYERVEHTAIYTGHVKDNSYVSPIDFTRENISPRVSGVTASSHGYEYQELEKKSKASDKHKKSHKKKHGGKKHQ